MQNRNGVRLPDLQSLGALSNPHGACAKTALDSLLAGCRDSAFIRTHTNHLSIIVLSIPFVLCPRCRSSSVHPDYFCLSHILSLVLPIVFRFLVAPCPISLVSLVLFSSSRRPSFPSTSPDWVAGTFEGPRLSSAYCCFQSTPMCLIISLTKRVMFSALPLTSKRTSTEASILHAILRVVHDCIPIYQFVTGTQYLLL